MAGLVGDGAGSGTFVADGTSTPFALTHKCSFQLVVWGTGGNNFGGGAVTAKFSPDGGTTYISINGLSINANGTSGRIEASQGDKFEVIMTGSTSPSVSWVAREVVR